MGQILTDEESNTQKAGAGPLSSRPKPRFLAGRPESAAQTKDKGKAASRVWSHTIEVLRLDFNH